MCPESFGGVRFDIILCMSHFNHVLSEDTLHLDAISSFFISFCLSNYVQIQKGQRNTLSLSKTNLEQFITTIWLNVELHQELSHHWEFKLENSIT